MCLSAGKVNNATESHYCIDAQTFTPFHSSLNMRLYRNNTFSRVNRMKRLASLSSLALAIGASFAIPLTLRHLHHPGDLFIFPLAPEPALRWSVENGVTWACLRKRRVEFLHSAAGSRSEIQWWRDPRVATPFFSMAAAPASGSLVAQCGQSRLAAL